LKAHDHVKEKQIKMIRRIKNQLIGKAKEFLKERELKEESKGTRV